MAFLHEAALSFLPTSALLRREFITSLRLVRHFVIMATIVVVVALIGWSTLPQATNLSAMVMWSKDFFGGMVVILAIAAFLTVPAMAGSAVVSEYEGQTMELLACSYARPWSCLLAKFVCSAGFYVLLLLGAMPAYGIVYFAAGLDLDVMFRCLVVLLSWVASMTAAGLLCSTYFRRPAFALGASYIAALFLTGAPFFLLIIVLRLLRMTNNPEQLLIASIHFSPILSLVDVFSRAPGSRLFSLNASTVHGFIHCLVGLLLFSWAGWRLRRNWHRGHIEARQPRAIVRTRKGKRTEVTDSRAIRWLDPIVFKDIVCELGMWDRSGRWVRRAIFVVCFAATAILLILRVKQSSDYDEALVGWMSLQAFLALLVTPPFAIHLFSKERDRETIDSLRITLLRDWEVVRGKIFAALCAGSQVFFTALFAALPLYLLDEPFLGAHLTLTYGLMLLAASVWLALAVALLCSVMMDKLGASMTVAYIALVFFSVGIFFFVLLLQFVINGGSRVQEIYWVSPIFAFIEAGQRLGWGDTVDYLGRRGQCIASIAMWFALGTVLFAAVLPIYRRRYGRTQPRPKRHATLAGVSIVLGFLSFVMATSVAVAPVYFAASVPWWESLSVPATILWVSLAFAAGNLFLLPGCRSLGTVLAIVLTASVLPLQLFVLLLSERRLLLYESSIPFVVALETATLAGALCLAWLLRGTNAESAA